MHSAFTNRRLYRRVRPAITVAVIGSLTASLLAGCSSGGSYSTTSARAGGTPAADGRLGAESLANAPGAASGSRSGAAGVAPGRGASAGPAAVSKFAAPLVGSRKVTRTASLDVQVEKIDVAAAKVRAIAAGLQAQVVNEQIGQGLPGGPVPLTDQSKASGGSRAGDLGGFGTLTLSVPADKLDIAMNQLSVGIGTVLRRTTSSQDVTAQYVDTTSRLKTMRASVERVRALMTQAKTIGQVVALESELSRREADLESLESQLAALSDSVDQSSLTVSLSTAGQEPVTTAGFVAGLRSGWDAFTASAGGLARAVGAVLPFAVFFALVGAPVVWWLRRRRQSSTRTAVA